MGIAIITEYPLWFLLFCFALGAIVTALLYYHNSKYNLSVWLTRLLTVTRFLLVSLLSFLLLSPLLKTSLRNVEKPVIIVAQDNSSSVLINKDSLFYKTTYKKNLEEFIAALREDFDVGVYSFGDKVKDTLNLKFTENSTNISAFFDEMQSRYTNRNVGAVVLASDGIYNKGKNPLYASSYASYPIYTMALGDTTVYRDIFISKINSNNFAYLGNKFPVEIDVG